MINPRWKCGRPLLIGAGIGKLHARNATQLPLGLDAVETPVVVQQKLMRHADIRKTMNIYGDIVTDEMSASKVSSVPS